MSKREIPSGGAEQSGLTATAAVATGPDTPFEFHEVELLPPRADEVLVRIVASGICHTDVAVKEQSVELPLPMVLGHEGAGVVPCVPTVHSYQPVVGFGQWSW